MENENLKKNNLIVEGADPERQQKVANEQQKMSRLAQRRASKSNPVSAPASAPNNAPRTNVGANPALKTFKEQRANRDLSQIQPETYKTLKDFASKQKLDVETFIDKYGAGNVYDAIDAANAMISDKEKLQGVKATTSGIKEIQKNLNERYHIPEEKRETGIRDILGVNIPDVRSTLRDYNTEEDADEMTELIFEAMGFEEGKRKAREERRGIPKTPAEIRQAIVSTPYLLDYIRDVRGFNDYNDKALLDKLTKNKSYFDYLSKNKKQPLSDFDKKTGVPLSAEEQENLWDVVFGKTKKEKDAFVNDFEKYSKKRNEREKARNFSGSYVPRETEVDESPYEKEQKAKIAAENQKNKMLMSTSNYNVKNDIEDWLTGMSKEGKTELDNEGNILVSNLENEGDVELLRQKLMNNFGVHRDRIRYNPTKGYIKIEADPETKFDVDTKKEMNKLLPGSQVKKNPNGSLTIKLGENNENINDILRKFKKYFNFDTRDPDSEGGRKEAELFNNAISVDPNTRTININLNGRMKNKISSSANKMFKDEDDTTQWLTQEKKEELDDSEKELGD